MTFFSGFVTKFSRFLDKLAGLFLAATVALIVLNILLRVTVHKPFLGTYELVSLFSAALVGTALAQCAVQKGHIAITIVTDKLPELLQAVIDSMVTLVSLVFWGLTAWQMMEYGHSLIVTGVVSSTTQIPFYPFVFLVAFGFLALCMVLAIQFVESVGKVVSVYECRNRRAFRSLDIHSTDNA